MNMHMATSMIRVRYRETDQMGVAWHGNYVEWFEVARTDWLREQGLSYRELEEQGVLLPVLRVGCTYHHAAKYDDELAITTSMVQYTGLRVHFVYVVTRGDGLRIADGETEHVFTDKSLKPLRMERHRPDVHQLLVQLS